MRALCSQCQRVTKLPEDKFPRFLNERICGQDASGYPSAQFCSSYTGMCMQQKMYQDLLRRTDKYTEINSPDPKYDKVYQQVWEVYTQKIRSCCECQGFQ